MICNQSISLLVPTLNEEEGLKVLFSSLPSYIDKVIIVDSYSTEQLREVGVDDGDTVYDIAGGVLSSLIHCLSESMV